jgi:serine/threonine protein kinase
MGEVCRVYDVAEVDGHAAAHEKGILHRDLKPANVMIDGRGQVRITDFGLAGWAGEITGPEISAGTPDHMSPEQIDGKGVSVQSDIYALGHVPFDQPVAVLTASRREPLRSPGQVTLLLLVTAGALFLARRNWRIGRGDRRGATRWSGGMS